MKLDKCSSSSCELLEADPTFAAYSVIVTLTGRGSPRHGQFIRNCEVTTATIPWYVECRISVPLTIVQWNLS